MSMLVNRNYKSPEESILAEKSPEAYTFLQNIFNVNAQRLPTEEDYQKYIQLNFTNTYSRDELDKDMSLFYFRYAYVNYTFPILSHEFITNLSSFIKVKSFKNVVDLCCGIGWLSWWLKKYGIDNITAVDNLSWHRYSEDDYFDFVKKADACEYVTNNPIDLIILSWPEYDKDIALNIWEAMKPGQWLLYIGETEGGCTANDAFFKAVIGHKVEDMWNLQNSFLSFLSIHDRPIVYRK